MCEGLELILQNNWRASLTLPEALNAWRASQHPCTHMTAHKHFFRKGRRLNPLDLPVKHRSMEGNLPFSSSQAFTRNKLRIKPSQNGHIHHRKTIKNCIDYIVKTIRPPISGSAKGLNCTCIANPTLGYHGNTANMEALKCPGVHHNVTSNGRWWSGLEM